MVSVLALVLAGCAGGAQRLPECLGKSTPINVPADAAGAARGG